MTGRPESTSELTARDGDSGPLDRPPLVRALLATSSEQLGASNVTLVQTHISWVILAGDYAYKIKKPVKLAFLDFSSLKMRKQFCETELRLNQRYSPDIYLDVLAIYGTPEHPSWAGEGQAIEYAVHMRRFDESQRLDRVCDRGELTPDHITDLARKVVTFHDSAVKARTGSFFGSASIIKNQAISNLDELSRLNPDVSMQGRLLQLRRWTERQCSQLDSLMECRQQQGYVRECHGDLHLGNMVLLHQQVRLFDCIEFSDEFRWIDTASDVAFAYVDLLAHHHPGLASWFINEVMLRNGDYKSAPLLRFYAVYRALVLSKVRQLQGMNSPIRPGGAIDYLAVAERLTLPQKATLHITHGLSGCGKTFTTSAMLQSDGAANSLRLRVDSERKRLYHLDLLQQTGSALNAGIYGPEQTASTYAHMLEVAAYLLQAQWSVIVDGTFLLRAQRDVFRKLAREHNADFGIIAPYAPVEVLQTRICKRLAFQDDPSEATLEVLSRQMDIVEPLGPDELVAD